jgi:hypothetical protein
MDDLVITVERRLKGQKLASRICITDSAMEQTKDQLELVNIAFNDLWRKFSYEYDMEKANLQYAPKPFYNTMGGI